jgi:ribosomal protein L16/L10AE
MEYRLFCTALLLALVGCTTNRPSSIHRVAHAHAHDGIVARRPADVRVAPVRVMDGYGLAESTAWVCEVEASQKIFTGMGVSQEEASKAAHTTCASHLQASYCRKTECKENL